MDELKKQSPPGRHLDPMRVAIGMRAKVRFHPGDEKQRAYPVFVPAEGV